MNAPGGNTAVARCVDCDHFHIGDRCEICVCPPDPEVPEPRPIRRAARRAWFTDRWRWAHFETRTHSGVSTLAMWSLRRRRG